MADSGVGPSWSLELRARPELGISAEERHGLIMAGLGRVPSPWALTPLGESLSPWGEELVTVLELAFSSQQAPVRLLEAHISYPLRNATYLRDAAQYDDQLVLRFASPPPVPLRFLAEAMASYVQASGPYRGALVVDQELAADEWEVCAAVGRQSGRDVDGRDSVFRIWPVSFFDRELSRRAWGLSPERIAEVLAPRVQETRLIADGVLVIATNGIPTREELLATNMHLQEALAAARDEE